MIEAQNAYKRRRGAAELTEADVHRMAREQEELRDRARVAHARLFGEPEDET